MYKFRRYYNVNEYLDKATCYIFQNWLLYKNGPHAAIDPLIVFINYQNYHEVLLFYELQHIKIRLSKWKKDVYCNHIIILS